jgi:hypothetical protein
MLASNHPSFFEQIALEESEIFPALHYWPPLLTVFPNQAGKIIRVT